MTRTRTKTGEGKGKGKDKDEDNDNDKDKDKDKDEGCRLQVPSFYCEKLALLGTSCSKKKPKTGRK